jgi:hypothetical protein
MKTESDCKLVFKKSIRCIGGVSYSLNSAIQSGLPDLYVNIPGRIPLLVEAKYIKDPSDKFNRKINYSAIQENILNECEKIQKGSAWGAIFIKLGRDYYMVFVSPGVSHISYLFREKHAWAKYNKSLKLFELDNFLEVCKIPFVHTEKPLTNISLEQNLNGLVADELVGT